MVAAMGVGMVVSAWIFVAMSGASVDESLRRHAVLFVVVQALGMTMPMVAWIRRRGHSRRDCAEMAVAMLAPARAQRAALGARRRRQAAWRLG
jgi:hypothetical protein